MKKFLEITSGILFYLISSNSVLAGESDAGTISQLQFLKGGQVLFRVSGEHSNSPSCPNLIRGRWAIDGTTSEGKVQISGLLAAYTAGKIIKVEGTRDCYVWRDTETVNHFFIVD